MSKTFLRLSRILLRNRVESDNAPINVKPEGRGRGGGVGHRVGILTFSKLNYFNLINYLIDLIYLIIKLN